MPWPAARTAATHERRAKLIQMRVRGLPYERIALDLAYTSASAARKDFTRAKEEARELATVEAETWRELESDRYDAIIHAHWDSATSGDDLKAADLVRKAIGDQASLWGIKSLQIDATVTEVTQQDLALQEMIQEAKARNAVKLAELRGQGTAEGDA